MKLSIFPLLFLPVLVVPACKKSGETPSATSEEAAKPGKSVSGPSPRGERPPRNGETTIVSPRPKAGSGDSISEIAGRYLEKDPAAGLEWAKTLTDPTIKAEVMEQLAWAVTSDLNVSLKAYEEVPSSERKRRLSSYLAAEYAHKDPEEALKWAKARSAQEDRDEALCGWATAVADKEPARAAVIVVDDIPRGIVQLRGVVAVVQRWARTDPKAASEWVYDFPEGDLKDDALKELEAAQAELEKK